MMFKRIGECNLCGQCCGAEGSPNQANPWNGSWPESVRTWKYDNFAGRWPLAKFFGIIPNPNTGNVFLFERSGATRIGDKEYPWVWVPGHAVCKAENNIECPFLMPDPGDETRPCALVGTEHEHVWMITCKPFPPDEFTEKQVNEWFENHPRCSFEYVKE